MANEEDVRRAYESLGNPSRAGPSLLPSLCLPPLILSFNPLCYFLLTIVSLIVSFELPISKLEASRVALTSSLCLLNFFLLGEETRIVFHVASIIDLSPIWLASDHCHKVNVDGSKLLSFQL